MLHLHHLASALEAKRAEFVGFERELQRRAETYQRRLAELGTASVEEVQARAAHESAPGALPSVELDEVGGLSLEFNAAWRSHEEARAWAVDVLHERTTFAADGSQILPGRDISVPLAAVQVAFFENPHRRETDYTKDIELQIIAPDELLLNNGISNDAYVSLCRFKLEVEHINRFIERHRSWQERGERMPLAFFDGTLLFQLSVRSGFEGDASSANHLTQAVTSYIETLKNLVLRSSEARVPVVGYIDCSYARDLVTLLNTLAHDARPHASKIFDTQLLALCGAEPSGAVLGGWGARTIFFYCLRRGLLNDFVDEAGHPLVGFTYLQTTGGDAPARLDIPRWVHEAGLLDETIDTVRAECVVGNGYPYAIETADHAAVLSIQDREQFIRAVRSFAEKEGLAIQPARKAMSKSHRR